MSFCRTLTIALPPLIFSACQEYDFVGQKEKAAPGTEPTTDQTVTVGESTQTCPPADLSPGIVPIDPSCVANTVPSWTSVIEWRDQSLGDVYSTPTVGHLTDDDGNGWIGTGDMPDVVVANAVGEVFALSGDGSGQHWSYDLGITIPSSTAIGDLDGDGFPEVVVGTDAHVTALRGDGTVLWQSIGAPLDNTYWHGAIGLYDLDADGSTEVVFGNVILDANGGLRGVGAHGIGSGYDFFGPFGPISVAADIDLDGQQEVVVGNALYDADGNAIWSNGEPDGFVAVANFDGDDYGEIVVTWDGNCRLQDDDGTVLWSANYTGIRSGPPVVADFDGDGEPEIGFAGPSEYVMLEADGTLRWSAPTDDDSSGSTGSSAFDFDGDGWPEVVYADEHDVFILDGPTGALRMRETQHSNGTAMEFPVIADVDDDGHAEIIYASFTYNQSNEQGITVIGDVADAWMPARPVWNQHGYNIANTDDFGQIPAAPAAAWLTHNSFRSATELPATAGELADAVPNIEVCTDTCDQGEIRVIARVGNRGRWALPAGAKVTLEALQMGEWQAVDSAALPDAVEPGESSVGIAFFLDPLDIPTGDLRVVVDLLTEGLECEYENNVLELNGVACD